MVAVAASDLNQGVGADQTTGLVALAAVAPVDEVVLGLEVVVERGVESEELMVLHGSMQFCLDK